VLGLLYGKKDFTQTLEIATRAGQDADCNPSSAGGILGTILGYDKIPSYWKMGLAEAEEINFKYTDISLNKVYDIGFKHALDNISRNKGNIDGDKVTLSVQGWARDKFASRDAQLYVREGDRWRIAGAKSEIKETAH
jgi:hypothetical protein